jgi:Flp pilus assembly protein TadD
MTKRWLGAILVSVLLCMTWLWWICRFDDSIPFLPRDSAAKWIIYPKPPDSLPHPAAPASTVFRRSFNLSSVPPGVLVRARVFRQGQVFINDQPVLELGLDQSQWKTIRKTEVTQFLRPGRNEIAVAVTNPLGPPALWLWLGADRTMIQSDRDWEASILGAFPQSAAPAEEPPAIRPRNYFYGRETLSLSLAHAWPALLIILLAAVAITVSVSWWDRNKGPIEFKMFDGPTGVFLLIVLCWVVLFANNLPQLAALFGFDRDGHLQYINHILEKHSLPLADEGWQMYQPPFYYLISALGLAPFTNNASSDEAILALRVFSAVIGLVHLLLIFLCLRVVFPRQNSAQVIGILMAAFLPANLYLCHHPTNENLGALFVTAALFFTLRVLRSESPSSRDLTAVGAFLGAAMLTKFSALLVIPFVFAALAWPRKGWGVSSAVKPITLALLSFLVVCGWHYGRVWLHFGRPLVGNWDATLPYVWWQDPGFRTSPYYTHLGEILGRPLFSSLNDFVDGFYCSLWGDGLCSGSARMDFRPPWNYDLMNCSYLLGAIGTGLFLLGFINSVIRSLRELNAERFLHGGIIFAFALGVIFMTLQVPSYAQVKAFYGLPALLPFCLFVALGWDYLSKKGSILRRILWVGTIAWVITVYASFWIASRNPFTYSTQGITHADDKRYEEAVADFSRALRLDPNSVGAARGLIDALNRLGRFEESRREVARALRLHADEPEILIQAAITLTIDGKWEEAVSKLRTALALAPDHPFAYQQLATCFVRLGRQQDVMEASTHGLRINPFDPDLHLMLATAASATGDLTNAVTHARFALQLKSDSIEALNLLASTLLAQGKPDEAALEYEKVLLVKPDDAKLHYEYGMVLAFLNRTREAIAQYRRALALQPEMVESLNNLSWLLATASAAELRDGSQAVSLAELACELTRRREPVFLGTLAAAYAEAGKFSDAIKTAELARNLAESGGQKEVAQRNKELLELYRSGKPFHEEPRAR